MNMTQHGDAKLSDDEQRSFRAVAGLMIPASREFDIPGADDDVIFADIRASLGLDADAVHDALTRLHALSGAVFADLPSSTQALIAEEWRGTGDPNVMVLSRTILQCYYRDDRVMRSLGMEVRAPFPKGHVLERNSDWSLLEPVRQRGKIWRDVPPA